MRSHVLFDVWRRRSHYRLVMKVIYWGRRRWGTCWRRKPTLHLERDLWGHLLHYCKKNSMAKIKHWLDLFYSCTCLNEVTVKVKNKGVATVSDENWASFHLVALRTQKGVWCLYSHKLVTNILSGHSSNLLGHLSWLKGGETSLTGPLTADVPSSLGAQNCGCHQNMLSSDIWGQKIPSLQKKHMNVCVVFTTQIHMLPPLHVKLGELCLAKAWAHSAHKLFHPAHKT